MPKIKIKKIVRSKKNIIDKGKYLVKEVDQPITKLVWKLKYKNGKSMWNYNFKLRDVTHIKGVKYDVKNINMGNE